MAKKSIEFYNKLYRNIQNFTENNNFLHIKLYNTTYSTWTAEYRIENYRNYKYSMVCPQKSYRIIYKKSTKYSIKIQ